jgi:SAM-dependent methyltransferase
MKNQLSIFLVIAFLLSACAGQPAANFARQPAAQTAKVPGYEILSKRDPDGIGKSYMGREISHVMGHLGAGWLERPEREKEELPDKVVENMQLKATDVVADIGAGTGYFTFRISPRVAQGKVYAVDIQTEMLGMIEERKKRFKAENVIAVLGTETDTRLPADSVDIALLVDAYHEFSFPREMMESIFRGLKPGGRVVQIEYRGEDPEIPIKRLHKMTVAQARKEMAVVGLVWKETKGFLPQQHFLVFEKPR